jgi:hypothetical protein
MKQTNQTIDIHVAPFSPDECEYVQQRKWFIYSYDNESKPTRGSWQYDWTASFVTIDISSKHVTIDIEWPKLQDDKGSTRYN